LHQAFGGIAEKATVDRTFVASHDSFCDGVEGTDPSIVWGVAGDVAPSDSLFENN